MEMDCCACKHQKWLIDSDGEMIYFCMNTESPAYCEIVGVLGGCQKGETNATED